MLLFLYLYFSYSHYYAMFCYCVISHLSIGDGIMFPTVFNLIIHIHLKVVLAAYKKFSLACIETYYRTIRNKNGFLPRPNFCGRGRSVMTCVKTWPTACSIEQSTTQYPKVNLLRRTSRSLYYAVPWWLSLLHHLTCCLCNYIRDCATLCSDGAIPTTLTTAYKSPTLCSSSRVVPGIVFQHIC
jgi:hypothetical protein